MILIITFLVVGILSFDPSCFKVKRVATITNLGVARSNEDVVIEINTEQMIIDGRIADCDDIRFSNGTAFLEYWLEGECDTKNTRIWVTVSSIGALSSIEIDVLYDCDGIVPSDGAQIPFSGKFFVFSNTTCKGSWTDRSDVQDRFIKIEASPNGVQDGMLKNHSHEYSGEFQSPSCSSITLLSAGVLVDPIQFSSEGHTHLFVGNTSLPMPTGLPPYMGLRLCEGTHLDLFKESIFIFNDSYSTDHIARMTELDTYYPLAGTSQIMMMGGSNDHYHEYFSYVDKTSDTAQRYSGGGTNQQESGTGHRHFVNGSTDLQSNEPNTLTVPFGVSINEEMIDANHFDYMLIFSDSVPPKGWTQLNDFDGRYIRAGDYEETDNNPGIFNDLQFSDYNPVMSARNSRFTTSDGTAPTGFFLCPPYHDHVPAFVVVEDAEETEFDRFEVMTLGRKFQGVSVVLGVEEFMCYGKDSGEYDVCSGNGDCIGANTCNCSKNYEGYNCHIWYCDSIMMNGSVCNGHGDCVGHNNCSCDTTDYREDLYCLWECDGILKTNLANVCSVHGECVDFNNCSCADDITYSGTYCEWECFGDWWYDGAACSDGLGDCVDADNCTCYDNYDGERCNETTCFGYDNTNVDVCTKKGDCDFFDDCECFDDYYSYNCSITTCEGIYSNESDVCNNYGICWPHDVCACRKNYYGEFCNITTCFGFYSNETSQVCSGHGKCLPTDVCTCKPNWYGEYCNITTCGGTFSNDTRVCSGYGDCYGYNECDCEDDYHGDVCYDTTCYGVWNNVSKACGDGTGECFPKDHCSCENFYYGKYCNVTECTNNLGENYYSNDTASVCTGRGDCWPVEHCHCNPTYYQFDCGVTTCEGAWSNITSTCGGEGGVCVEFDECQCGDGYYTKNCNVTECDGLLSNQTGVCQDEGYCWPREHCVCNDDYYGIYCQVTTCFGEWGNDTACNMITAQPTRGGDCFPMDSCVCKDNYYGKTCNVSTCGGIMSNETDRVCNGHGICDSYENCICESPRYDAPTYCSWQCGGVDFDDIPAVCNGRGDCVDDNFCICTEDGYYGRKCDVFECYGVNSTESSVCSGNGDCTGPDNCKCPAIWVGAECTILVPAIGGGVAAGIIVPGVLLVVCVVCCIIVGIIGAIVAVVVIFMSKKKKTKTARETKQHEEEMDDALSMI